MSAQPAEHADQEQPLISMPPIAEASLRVAVRRLDLVAAVKYEEEFRTAWEEALQSESILPMRNFLQRWAMFVALHRHPARSARFRRLEAASAASDDRAEIYEAAAEMSRMLTAAANEVAAQ